MRNKQRAAGTGLGAWPEFGSLSSVRTGSGPSRCRLPRQAAGLCFLPALMFLAAVSLSGCAAEPDAPPVPTVQPGPGVPPLVATCSNGVVVPNPGDNPGLVGDCVALLEAWTTLGGEGRLGWYPRVPINEWMGVTVEGKPKRVRRLEIFGFRLIGRIPGSLGKLTALERLDLSVNELHREIPAELGGLTNLESLDLQVNHLTGEVPASFGRLQKLEKLHLGGNELTGCIPQSLQNIPFNDLDQLPLKVCGDLPAGPAASSPTPQPASVTACSNGTAVPEPYYAPQLIIDCSILLEVRDTLAGSGDLDWDPGRPVTQWEGVVVDRRNGRLHVLELPQRRLAGQIPPELGEIKVLRQLVLQNNELTGEIPEGLKSARGLERLDLSGNGLSGEIPDWLTGLSGLTELHLDGNGFTGCVPADLFEIFDNDLDRLDLSPC